MLNHLRSFKNSCLHSGALRLNYKAPIFQSFLLAQFFDHFSNASVLLTWVDSCLGQTVTHANRFLGACGYTINQAKLGGKVRISSRDLNQEKRLMQSITLLFISLAEIFSKRHHLATTLKLVGAWSKLEVDVLDNVLTLVAPVSHNAASDKLVTTAHLPFFFIAGIFS